MRRERRAPVSLAGLPSIALMLGFSCARPPGAGEAAWRAAVDRVYRPLIELLLATESLRVNLHLPGALLEHLEAHEPVLLEGLVKLVLEKRVEVVLAPQGGALLPAVPERDAVGQLQVALRWWRQHGEVVTRGAWMPYGAWDPALVRLLGRMGFHYTVLDEELLSPPARLDGYHLTEREGTGLAVFPAATSLTLSMLREAPERALERLVPFIRDGARALTVVVSDVHLGVGADQAARRMIGGPESWLRRFVAALVDNAHTVKLAHFAQALDRMRPTDRIYPPAVVTPMVAMAALGAHGDGWAALLDGARRGEDPALVGAARFLRPIPWDPILAVSPEVHRLHKRMLTASAAVLRLRNHHRDEGNRGDEGLAEALQDATAALYRGQDASAYVLGVEVGGHHPAVRHEAYRNLIRAEHLVRTALGESGATSVETLDYDVDGRSEILVRTPWLMGVVSPGCGGALIELDSWNLAANVLNIASRRPEAGHEPIRRSENLPALADEHLVVVDEEEDPGPAVPPLASGLADRLFYDRHVRASFVDHFLGPEASLDNIRRGRFPEAGDFVGADYAVLRIEEDGDGWQNVALARDGNVVIGDALRLVRVVKRYVFPTDQARVELRYEVGNRYHEPIRTRFAVELGVNLDGRRDAGRFLEVDGLPVELGATSETEDVGEVALVDADLGARIWLTTQQRATLWTHPIETVGRTPNGVEAIYQGMAIWLVWTLELWGQEKRRFQLTLGVDG